MNDDQRKVAHPYPLPDGREVRVLRTWRRPGTGVVFVEVALGVAASDAWLLTQFNWLLDALAAHSLGEEWLGRSARMLLRNEVAGLCATVEGQRLNRLGEAELARLAGRVAGTRCVRADDLVRAIRHIHGPADATHSSEIIADLAGAHREGLPLLTSAAARARAAEPQGMAERIDRGAPIAPAPGSFRTSVLELLLDLGVAPSTREAPLLRAELSRSVHLTVMIARCQINGGSIRLGDRQVHVGSGDLEVIARLADIALELSRTPELADDPAAQRFFADTLSHAESAATSDEERVTRLAQVAAAIVQARVRRAPSPTPAIPAPRDGGA